MVLFKIKNPLLVLIVVLAIFFFVSSGDLTKKTAITGAETIVRNLPSQVDAGSTFQVTYVAQSTTGSWGASIEDSVSGGCTFPSGSNTYKTVMLSEDGNTKTITMNSPNSDATCFFSGDYKFGTESVKTMPSSSIDVQTCQASCVRPSNLCTQASSVSDGCGGVCTGSWTVSKLTNADNDCNSIISRTELGTAINSWVGGTMSRNDLGVAISSWVGGN